MWFTRTWAIGLAGAGIAFGSAVASELADQTIALPKDVVDSAAIFEGYMSRAAAIDIGFKDEAAVGSGLKSVAAYEPKQLEQGMIAYGAVAALKDDAFVAGVAQQAAAKGPDALAAQLIADPSAAMQIPGSDEAVRLVAAALQAKASPLVAAGSQAKAASYTIQHQAWSRVMVPDPQGRLAEVKTLSAAPAQAGDSDARAMIAALAGAAQGGPAAQAAATQVETRALALAAEAVLGHAVDSERDRLTPLLSEPEGAECLKMAKLNLYQCMAVAGPQYEDVFCMAQHAMTDTGQCVAAAAQGRTLSPAPQLASTPSSPTVPAATAAAAPTAVAAAAPATVSQPAAKVELAAGAP